MRFIGILPLFAVLAGPITPLPAQGQPPAAPADRTASPPDAGAPSRHEITINAPNESWQPSDLRPAGCGFWLTHAKTGATICLMNAEGTVRETAKSYFDFGAKQRHLKQEPMRISKDGKLAWFEFCSTERSKDGKNDCGRVAVSTLMGRPGTVVIAVGSWSKAERKQMGAEFEQIVLGLTVE